MANIAWEKITIPITVVASLVGGGFYVGITSTTYAEGLKRVEDKVDLRIGELVRTVEKLSSLVERNSDTKADIAIMNQMFSYADRRTEEQGIRIIELKKEQREDNKDILEKLDVLNKHIVENNR